MAGTAAIRTYFQCEACEFGSFEIKEIELHMHETHTRWPMATAVDANVDESLVKTVELDSNELVGEDVDEDRGGGKCEVSLNSSTSDAIAEGRSPAAAAVARQPIVVRLLGVDSNSDSDPNDVIWSNGAVRLLIALVQQDLDKFTSPTTPKHYLWKGISSKMADRGYNYTHVRCDNKWRSLKKTYRNARQLIRAGKTDAKKWKFYEVMDEFMADQEQEEVAAATENGGTAPASVAGNETIGGNGSTPRRSSMATAKKRRRPPLQRGSSSADDDDEGGGDDEDRVETNRERRHREKMEQMKRFNDLFELFVCNNKSIADGHHSRHHQAA